MISNRIVPARPRARGSKDPVPYLLSIGIKPPRTQVIRFNYHTAQLTIISANRASGI